VELAIKVFTITPSPILCLIFRILDKLNASVVLPIPFTPQINITKGLFWFLKKLLILKTGSEFILFIK